MHMPPARRACAGFYDVAFMEHTQCLDRKAKRGLTGTNRGSPARLLWKSDENIAALLTALSTAQISIWRNKEKS
jgi:hypothetical protein